MITKEKLLEQIANLPNEFSIDDLVEKLIFIEKLESRILESEGNKIISEEELNLEIEKW